MSSFCKILGLGPWEFSFEDSLIILLLPFTNDLPPLYGLILLIDLLVSIFEFLDICNFDYASNNSRQILIIVSLE